MGHRSVNKSQGAFKIDEKKSCSNGGERFYLFDEDFVGCKCTWFYGRTRCEK